MGLDWDPEKGILTLQSSLLPVVQRTENKLSCRKDTRLHISMSHSSTQKGRCLFSQRFIKHLLFVACLRQMFKVPFKEENRIVVDEYM